MKVRSGFDTERIRDLSFEQILENLSARQSAVYNMVLEFGPISLEETADLMNVQKNYISGRFTELNKLELIEHVGETMNKEKTRKICLWSVKKWNPQIAFQFGKV